MPKDRSEQRMYRKSPGRQYGYTYNPLESPQKQNELDTDWPAQDETASRPQLVQRPNLRRTRQLLRQTIIANKARPDSEGSETAKSTEPIPSFKQRGDAPTSYIRRTQTDHGTQPQIPFTRELMDDGELEDFGDVDPNTNYEELDMGYSEPFQGMPTRPPSQQHRYPGQSRPPQQYDDDEYEYEEYEDDESPVRRRKKVSRRGVLLGLGAAAVGGAAITAYELGPKLPQAISSGLANVEHQLQDAFNKGVAQGAENARREIINSLDTLEGFTLDGAVTAAKLTRVAYDVFVSPIVKFGSVVATDFLNIMLRAFMTGRGWLRNIGQDNNTLGAIQQVLQAWTANISGLPKQLDAISHTDLDGAQAYLRALQQKIKDEQAKLNASGQSTAQPTVAPKQ